MMTMQTTALFDNSIGLPDGYLEGQYEFNRRLGVKKLHWEDGKPYCYTLDGHQKTGLLCLHFVGVTKIFMEGIYEHQDYAFGARFYTYLLTIRGHLADIKHGNTKFQQQHQNPAAPRKPARLPTTDRRSHHEA